MELYTVSQIADLLKTNPETVRRWIRDGKLKASKDSNKTGNVVTENDLERFLKKSPKYAGVAGATLASAGMLGGMIAPGLAAVTLGAMFISEYIGESHNKNAVDSYDEKYVRALIAKKIKSNENVISKKAENIKQLQKEIEELTKNNESLNLVLRNMFKEDDK